MVFDHRNACSAVSGDVIDAHAIDQSMSNVCMAKADEVTLSGRACFCEFQVCFNQDWIQKRCMPPQEEFIFWRRWVFDLSSFYSSTKRRVCGVPSAAFTISAFAIYIFNKAKLAFNTVWANFTLNGHITKSDIISFFHSHAGTAIPDNQIVAFFIVIIMIQLFCSPQAPSKRLKELTQLMRFKPWARNDIFLCLSIDF